MIHFVSSRIPKADSVLDEHLLWLLILVFVRFLEITQRVLEIHNGLHNVL